MIAYAVDGGVAVIVPAPDVSDQDAAKAVPDGVEWVSVSSLPDGDREAWVLSNGAVVVDASRKRVPDRIAFRQLVIGTARGDWITDEEMEAWAARAAIPAVLVSAINDLPAEYQAEARATVLTMTEAHRADPLLAMTAARLLPLLTEAEVADVLDAAFRDWETI